MAEENKEQLQSIRHSLAHLLADSLKQLFPGSLNAIGPAIENGFYQDFEIKGDFGEDDLKKVEKKMKETLKSWQGFERREVNLEEALEVFSNNKYKQELAKEFAEGGKTLTIYTSGDFVDLCKGGHVEDIKQINPDAFKLTKTAGAYWRGDEKNIMLTRVYGVAFETKEQLDKYIEMLEEAKKRDHRKLGKELDLFTFSDMVGSGLTLWSPRGTILRKGLNDYVQELRDSYDYQEVTTPHITKKELFQASGHWAKFSDELFKTTTREGHEFSLKPMSCPMHAQIYASQPRSYRDLPIRYRETAFVYRDEQSGELSGLSRVRCITQDDAHVFCRTTQIEEETLKIWDIIDKFYGNLGFSDLKIMFSTHDPEDMSAYAGDEEKWMQSEEQLLKIIKNKVGDEYTVGVGEAAFYGPKIDFMAFDAIGREHQLATIQLDFNQPEGFDLTCVNETSEAERVVMIHAAIMGSIERFLSVYIEHTGGKFPIWLAPEQLRIIQVKDSPELDGFVDEITASAKSAGIRLLTDRSHESVGKKIRNSELMKVPYTVVVGEKELETKMLTPRVRSDIAVENREEKSYPVDNFLTSIVNESKGRVQKSSL